MTRATQLFRATILLVPAALVAPACELPTKLGDLPSDSATDGPTSSEEGDDDSGGAETDSALCVEGGPAGELAWSHERDELPGFVLGLVTAPGGDVVAVGSQGEPAVRDAYVRKYDPAGALLWSRTYAGADGLLDTPLGVAVDAAGFVHVLVQEMHALSQDGASFDARLVVLRYTPDGALAWRWEHMELPFATDGSYQPIGELAVVGDTVVVLEHGGGAPLLRLELDASGQLLAQIELEVPPGVHVERMALDSDGSPVLAGEAGQNGSVWFGRFTPAGALAWDHQFGDADHGIDTVLPDGAGGVYLAWQRVVVAGTFEHRLRRYGADGAELWTVMLPVSDGDLVVAHGAVRCDGSLLLTGSLDLPQTEDWDMWIARYAGDGTQQWQLDQAFGFREGVRIAATPEGDPVISGLLLDSGDPPKTGPWLARFGGG
ncbi:hypothetical protein [Nannocystis radixulma]|uniref:Uncharacterized protein n=1 Tax=Nannocystis radixulma TaxID=2995305 RepID=A0ABT5BCM7_9BACT|nr:hypothetical protein [Nannocystis radixulma]MDC0671889.1 hypothetical protein [Nannocystis radixulma]